MPSTAHNVGLSGARRPNSSLFGWEEGVQSVRNILASAQFRDGLRLFLIGSALAFSRGILTRIARSLRRLILADVVVRSSDDAYLWILHAVTAHESWISSARDVEVRARAQLLVGEGGTQGELEGQVNGYSTGGAQGAGGPYYFPLPAQTFSMTLHGSRLWVSRERNVVGETATVDESILMTFWAPFSNRSVRSFMSAAKRAFEDHERGRVASFRLDRYGRWSRSGLLTKRPAQSVHLPGNLKEQLLDDARAFLADDTRRWYGERGIPYRRGYLLHGVPGSGKTSLVHVLASELSLPIYSLALSSRSMDDAKFEELIDDVPARSVILLEDVDAAFPTRPSSSSSDSHAAEEALQTAPTSSVTFSALLNALDGVRATEGRIVVMTTNHRERLDPALIRPGRIDFQIPFRHATPAQVEALVLRWYGTPSSQHTRITPSSADDVSAETAGDAGNEKARTPQIVDPNFAQNFASLIPPGIVTIAALQGHLLAYRTDPDEALRRVPEFVEELRKGGGGAADDQ